MSRLARSLMPLAALLTGLSGAAPASAADSCVSARNPSQSTATAKEIIDTATGTVYLAGSNRPIDDAAWLRYQPPPGIRKNSTRHLLFESACFLRSFTAPPDCREEGCLDVREIDGFSWVVLARSARQRCLPEADGCTPARGEPGNVRATALVKCQTLTFSGRIFDLEDGTGNRFVMHATGDGTPSRDVQLPPGWKITQRQLAEPLVVRPQSIGGCEYTLVRDARDQAYHQYDFSGEALFR